MTGELGAERGHGRRRSERLFRQLASSLLLATLETAAFCVCPASGGLLGRRLALPAVRVGWGVCELIVAMILRNAPIRGHVDARVRCDGKVARWVEKRARRTLVRSELKCKRHHRCRESRAEMMVAAQRKAES